MSRTTVAVIGCGHLGTIHARLLAARPDAELVAVVDPDPAARERVAAAHGCRALAEPGELVGLVSAAIVAAPTALHAAVSLPLLAGGIDLLVEKPLAADVESARSIVTAARRLGRIVAVGHVERFNPAWNLVADRLGTVGTIETRRLAPFSYRSLDVGVVHDLLIHDIDLVLSLRPGRLVGVDARGLAATGGHEDAVRARLEFASGLVADLVASRIHPEAERRATLWTSEGMFTIDMHARTADCLLPATGVRDGSWSAAAVPPAERPAAREAFFGTVIVRERLEAAADANALVEEQGDFLGAVRERTEPRVSAADGAAAVEIAHRVLDVLHTTSFRRERSGSLPVPVPRWPVRRTA
ncbi:MAG: Gfo/Idh/MocA family oxidoreductase [Planctomycetes bacterium]|nr:Gfo/Idh/MocA family oxidoreductase [Planctomycetota bacterium]